MVDGCVGVNTEVERSVVMANSGETASVRCCSMDGTTCETDQLDGGCHSGKTFLEALHICAANGHRLCTEAEVNDDVCCSSGCNFDGHHVWVSDIPVFHPHPVTTTLDGDTEICRPCVEGMSGCTHHALSDQLEALQPSGWCTLNCPMNAGGCGPGGGISGSHCVCGDTCLGTHEAETASFHGAVVHANTASAAHSGFSGSSFIDYINPNGDYIEWSVPSCSAGSVTASFRYSLSSGNRPLEVQVNGEQVTADLSFPATGGWNQWAEASVAIPVVEGTNVVRLVANGHSGANMDALIITPNLPQCLPCTAEMGGCTHHAVADATWCESNCPGGPGCGPGGGISGSHCVCT